MYTIDTSLPASPMVYNVGRGGRSVEWIVVHYTAHVAPARNFAQASHTPTYTAGSWHWCIDSESIYQSVHPANTAWHAGNSDFNRRSLGIEVVSDGEDFSQGEVDRLAWLVQKLMADYDVPASRVIRHYDVIDHVTTGSTVNPHKCCPAPYAPNGYDPCGTKWRELHDIITGKRRLEVFPMEFMGRATVKEPMYHFVGLSYKVVDDPDESEAIQKLYMLAEGKSMPLIQSQLVATYRDYLDDVNDNNLR
jgi:hypothetical protein